MDKTSHYLSQILKYYPDLKIVTARLNKQGQFNDGLIVNEEFIFRFPKLPPALDRLHIESAILRGIQEYVTLAVPNPTFSNLSSRALGESFLGYRLIPGEPFYRETYLQISAETQRQRIADQIAQFLHQLHFVPIHKAISVTLGRRDTRAEWAKLHDQFRQKLFPHLTARQKTRVERRFTAFLNEPANFQYRPVLRHGDFGTVNVLYAAETQTITGIIDFGNAALGDPAMDFASLMAPFSYGPAFLDRLKPTYPLENGLVERAQFYVSTFALKEALFGLEKGNPQAFEAGLAWFN